ncbi:MAG: ABC transporter substrate-binding protein [Aphanizomenon flos-aquae MDT14a]|jgi:TRAP-type mannitol/chloroaromatic compound transport system substrate-binding protein|uniref:ABC transporter substrate-binding protein n=1 Tax=Aphanizomenon flos-aquae LD13 TaxID=1710894 RepID=A0A1B7VZY8_APHFL|nr:TRAP transporter substrate-binding protein [Aphanizomenon flos-aquae UKL13-PB]OBQ26591.1 MAG: ABC transporter substrate-binding protein [Aphanizomenon flos-aquae LD13]OBQ28194.1 MAG: ABC transporter substrate-binding protein [Aphanizomenon flos-aquae MDT14a]HCQ23203.1 ABC transporter substrate-binding protein [Anabaena sp. UBA12330]
MKRRAIVNRLSQSAIAATGIAIVGGCQKAQNQGKTDTSNLPTIKWQMATSWPTSLDTIFGGAQVLAERVKFLTNGKFIIEARAAGEIAPGLEVLNVVSQGAVQAGHTAAYYYIGKSPALAFGTSVPFGLNAQQQNAWLYEGGGLAKLQEIYASKFNVIQFPAGNTGTQMGGWFRSEVKTLNDLKGLKMRIPGLGGQVMAKLGVTVQTLPGGEIFQGLQTGAIDAAEWIGPYDDEKLGLNKVAKFYYYPGWWELGPTLEVQVNLDEWKKLPPQYQAALETAAYQSNTIMLARYDARNGEALERLLKTGTQLRPYSQEILEAAEKTSFALYDEFAAKDADFKAVYELWKPFRDRIYAWNNINEGSFSRYAYGKLKAGN